MDAPKHLTGETSWVKTSYTGQYRWLAPLNIDGELTPMNLIIDSYPRLDILTFHVIIQCVTCVSRLDYSEAERHNNHKVKGVRTPAGVEMGWIFGPHYHRWEDNRMLNNAATPPKELEFAVRLPVEFRGFDSAFRWFCGDAKIVIAANQMPSLPLRDTLL